MAMTPVEIRHVQLGRSLRGYRRELVDRLLVDVADSFEDVWRERADLADRVEQLELDLVRHKELEGLLRTTLVSAESASTPSSAGSSRCSAPRSTASTTLRSTSASPSASPPARSVD